MKICSSRVTSEGLAGSEDLAIRVRIESVAGQS